MIIVYDGAGDKLSLDEISDDKFYLIRCIDPTEEEIEDIMKRFGLDERDVRDSLDLDEIPRIIKRRKYLLIIFSSLLITPTGLEGRSFGIFLINNMVITLERKIIPFDINEDRYTTQWRKLGLPEELKSPRDFLLYILGWNIKRFESTFESLEHKYKFLRKNISELSFWEYIQFGSKNMRNLTREAWRLQHDVALMLYVLEKDKDIYREVAKGGYIDRKKADEFLLEIEELERIVRAIERGLRSSVEACISVTFYMVERKISLLGVIVATLVFFQTVWMAYQMGIESFLYIVSNWSMIVVFIILITLFFAYLICRYG